MDKEAIKQKLKKLENEKKFIEARIIKLKNQLKELERKDKLQSNSTTKKEPKKPSKEIKNPRIFYRC